MGILELFKKKKTENQIKPGSTVDVTIYTGSKAKPKYDVIRGGFSNINKNYQAIRDVISKLEKLGYLLTKIRTSGYDSSHDCTVAYEKSYLSFDDFSKHAMTDYQDACSKRGTNDFDLDWDSTIFYLKQNQLTVNLITDNEKPSIIYGSRWLVHIPDGMTDNNQLLRETLDVLKSYE